MLGVPNISPDHSINFPYIILTCSLKLKHLTPKNFAEETIFLSLIVSKIFFLKKNQKVTPEKDKLSITFQTLNFLQKPSSSCGSFLKIFLCIGINLFLILHIFQQFYQQQQSSISLIKKVLMKMGYFWHWQNGASGFLTSQSQ